MYILYLIKYSTILIYHLLYYKIKKKQKKIRQKIIGKLLKVIFESLGCLFIKIGQLLAIRIDILPKEITHELEKLQDCVKSIDGKLIKNFIETANINLKKELIYFEEKPLATGSIAQIHKAILRTKKVVIIKILKPNVLKEIKITFLILNFFKLFLFNKKLRHEYINLIQQMQIIINKEINFRTEVLNMEKIKKNFQYDNSIKIPKIYHNLSNEKIITMEFIKNGHSMDDICYKKFPKTFISKITKKLIEIFFIQVFRDNFFHADLHPGNVWIKFYKNNKYKIILLDFGITSSMKYYDQFYMGHNILAFLNKDYKTIGQLHIKSKWIPKTSIKKITKDIKNIFKDILNKPLYNIHFQNIMKQIILLARKYKMNLQPQFLLFQKTLIVIEGLTRKIYSKTNMIVSIKPIIQEWLLKIQLKNIFSK